MLTARTSSGRWDRFPEQILDFLSQDTVDLVIDGAAVHGYRSPDNPALWIRDHSDIMRGGRYRTADMKSAVECFADAQATSGRIYDYVITQPEAWINARENWEKWVRIPVEADVEYRFVKATFLAYQATGDIAWTKRLLPNCEQALRYSMSHPWRWDHQHGLMKRAYTIDTWDFDYTANRHPWLNFQITDHTFWGISHADNSGLYEAMLLLAQMQEVCGSAEAASTWRAEADALKRRANKLLFNGRFYTHFHKLSPMSIAGVDEPNQLSLSNPMAINRGMATVDIARRIIAEYQLRLMQSGAFAEWYSIDPPFPTGAFGEDLLVPGAYVNGGVMPLVGGELARAALLHGEEGYGVNILERYRMLIERDEATFLWYFPDGTPSSEETSTSPEATPTDGWGSSSMLYGFVEGLAGVCDKDRTFNHVDFRPRWAATNETEGTIAMDYPASGASFAYAFKYTAEAIEFEISTEGSVALDVLIPEGKTCTGLSVGGRTGQHLEQELHQKHYVRSAPITVAGTKSLVLHLTDR